MSHISLSFTFASDSQCIIRFSIDDGTILTTTSGSWENWIVVQSPTNWDHHTITLYDHVFKDTSINRIQLDHRDGRYTLEITEL